MTKPKTKKTITLAEVLNALKAHELSAARLELESSIGARLSVSGVIEKVIKRHGGLRLFVKPYLPDGIKGFMVFAEFDDEAEQARVKAHKLRKGSKTVFTGISEPSAIVP